VVASPVAKTKAARPMERHGPGHLPLLHQDPGTRPWVRVRSAHHATGRRFRDAIGTGSSSALGAATPELSRDGLCSRSKNLFCLDCAPEYRAAPAPVLGLGVLLPDALPLAPGVACSLDRLEFEGRHPWQLDDSWKRTKTG